ncbi:hypothetical protein BX600DRAFT_447654 [Xylariales sp. PMI_506]|nr:hypothetical protein BX600DRAFT_447654 [Xylariales sp. PMI_506]
MSSPARSAPCDRYLIRSSSPSDLPPLSEIFKKSPKKPPLRSGSNAAPLPAAARTTFTSAAHILREAPEIDIDTEKITHSPVRKITKRRTKQSDRKLQNPTRTPTRSYSTDTSGANAIVVVSDAELSPQEKPWQKFKRKSSTPAVSTEPSPSLETSNGQTVPIQLPDTTIPQFEHTVPVADCVGSPKDSSLENPASRRDVSPLQDLPPQALAPARRRDWTPPPANSVTILDSESDNRELLSSIERRLATEGVFQNLYDKYASKDSENHAPPSAQPQPELVTEVLKKRKRIEPVSNANKNAVPRSPSPKKAPAAKKKARTITELATAPYMPEIPDLDLLAPGNKDALLRYFDADGRVQALVEHQSEVMDRENTKPKKKPATRRKKKSGTSEEPVLLSPATALQQSAAQDFVFGTSSQLMMEDSPTVLRDVLAAIRESNQEDDPFGSSPSHRHAKGKGLWHAAARDADGTLLEADEIIDLVQENSVVEPDIHDTLQGTAVASATSELVSNEFVDIGDICFSSPRGVVGPAQSGPCVSEPVGPRNSTFHKPTTPDTASRKSVSAMANEEVPVQRPTYDHLTDAQLAKRIKNFGFKPVKRRQAMIALLHQCWDSQHRGVAAASPNLGSTALISTSAAHGSPKKAVPRKTKITGDKSAAAVDPPKKPRGRPKKLDQQAPEASGALESKKATSRKKKTPATESDTVLAPKSAEKSPKKASLAKKPQSRKTTQKPTLKVVEIADSDEDDDALSSASSNDGVFSSPPPMDMSMSEEGDTTLNLSPTDQEEVLFLLITKAVKSSPPSKDPTSPSWHEKMLLYDPVVLEDLTAWLNAGELTKVGYDDEVSPAVVKKWCETKSVICLWRVNVHGKERKRY